MTLLVDVCLTPEWVDFFASHGVSAIHWSSVGPIDSEDRVIFGHAARNGLVVLTHDLDFGTLLAHTRSRKPSVIQARVEDPTPGYAGASVLAVLSQFSGELEKGAIITILPNRTKVRILPIQD